VTPARPRSARWHPLGLPILGAVGAVALWWSATVVFGIRPFFLPAPPDIVAAFRAQPAYLLREAGATVTETTVGFGIAVLTGLLLSVALTVWRALERATLPVLVALNSVPKVAVAPLLVVWLGFGPRPKIVLVVLICFFPIVVATMAGLTSTPAELGELSRSLSASVWQTYLKIRLPWALPQVFVGLFMGLGASFSVLITAEMMGVKAGLGWYLQWAQGWAAYANMYAALLVMAALCSGLITLLFKVRDRVLSWQKGTVKW
jgi:NitT/TauT family transport system permease protein